MDFGAGTSVTPNVRLVRELGHGGMGSVWVADHLTLDMQVAVKFIAKEIGGDNETARKRFEREAKAAAKIKSPHVVQMFDHGLLDDGTPYIVMELLEGESLAERLQRSKPMDPTEAAQVIRQVAKALGSAHRGGIVHRDIKPQNIFLTRADEELHVKVLDFGIAKPVAAMAKDSTVTRTGAMIGTPAYMSPEQMSDTKKVGPSSDLWSLAVVAYEAVTGKLPFEGDTPVSLWRAMCDADYQPPSLSAGSVPAELDEWFRRAFQVEPADRFPSASEQASAFEQAAKGLVSEQSPKNDIANAATEIATPSEVPSAQTETGELVREQTLGVPVEQTDVRGADGRSDDAERVVRAESATPKPMRSVEGVSVVSTTAGKWNPVTLAMIAIGALAVGSLIYWQLSTPPPSRGERRVVVTSMRTSHSSEPTVADAAAPASAASGAQAPNRPLRAKCTKQHDCSEKRTAWCDPDQKVIACCAPWLVATGRDGMCACPPGGTDDERAVKAGCQTQDAAPASTNSAGIEQTLRREFPTFHRCYESALARNVALTGKVAVAFVLTPDGDVFGARIADTTVGDTVFQQCLLVGFRKLRFAPPFRGTMSVEYPIKFASAP